MKLFHILLIIFILLAILVIFLLFTFSKSKTKQSKFPNLKNQLQSVDTEPITITLPSNILLKNLTESDLTISKNLLSLKYLPALYAEKNIRISQLTVVVENTHESLGNKVGGPDGKVYFAYGFDRDIDNFTVTIYSEDSDVETMQGNYNYALIAGLYRVYYYEADFNDLQEKLKPIYFNKISESPIIILKLNELL